VIVARTDVVGSLLRLRTLLQARERLERGEIGRPEFKRVEDAAVAEAIRLQEGLVKGGYDWLAQRLFPRVRAQRLLLEYDDKCSGGFEPLAAVPQDKTVVLGLVTTKSGR
jgi:methionine synthase II (cobalamin-independent)